MEMFRWLFENRWKRGQEIQRRLSRAARGNFIVVHDALRAETAEILARTGDYGTRPVLDESRVIERICNDTRITDKPPADKQASPGTESR